MVGLRSMPTRYACTTPCCIVFPAYVCTATIGMDNPRRLRPSGWSTYFGINCRYYCGKTNVIYCISLLVRVIKFCSQTKAERPIPVHPGIRRGVTSLCNPGGHTHPVTRALQVSRASCDAEFFFFTVLVDPIQLKSLF